MTNGVECDGDIGASQTLTCGSRSSDRSLNASECEAIEIDTNSSESNDRNCSSHCSNSDESADTRKSLIDLHGTSDTNGKHRKHKYSNFSKFFLSRTSKGTIIGGKT